MSRDRGEPRRYGTYGNEYSDNPRSSPYDDAAFQRLCDEITADILKISNNATALDRITKQIGTSKDSSELRQRLHGLESDTNTLVGRTRDSLNRFAKLCHGAGRQQKLYYERQKNEFQQAVNRYHLLQKKVVGVARLSLKQPSHTKSKQPPASDLIGWTDAGQQDQLVQAQEQQVIDDEYNFLQEREEQIRQLESDILDVNEIFRDLATLVHEQGEVIDCIENNVERAHDNVESGVGELQKAAVYQRKSRKKMCCIALILLVVVAIIILIIVLSVKH